MLIGQKTIQPQELGFSNVNGTLVPPQVSVETKLYNLLSVEITAMQELYGWGGKYVNPWICQILVESLLKW